LRVYSNFPHELPEKRDYPVVTLGVFDGVHRGHQRILARAFEVAAGRSVALVTFDPHPRAVLGPPKRARLLSPLPERLELLGSYPLAAVAVLRFDQQLARTRYQDFVRSVLLEGLGARELVLGYNVALGREREGDRERLAAFGRRVGYGTHVVDAVEVEVAPVSSTRIRHLLDAGRVDTARRLLGRGYTLTGTVTRGSGRGRVLGIPTANLQLHPEKLVPANGVYAVRVQVDSTQHAGAVNIGVVPTFQDSGARSVEAHLLGYTGDLYGAELKLEFVSRLRSERRFSGAEELVAQVQRDFEAARRLLEAWAASEKGPDNSGLGS
jgi:riboflavin kinase/FMN adenylyltransferase